MSRKLLISSFCAVLFWVAPMQAAAPTLKDWAENFTALPTQFAILDKVFPGQIGPIAQAQPGKKDTPAFFPKGGMWVRLGNGFASDLSAENRPVSYLVVTCMVYQRLDRNPMSAVSYLLKDTFSRATPLTGGYSAQEHASTVYLPKLKRSFLLIQSASPDGARGNQTTASLYDMTSALNGRPRPLWTSPRSLWNFRFGFDDLGGTKEALVLKAVSNGAEDDDFYVYRWNGEKFSRDEMTSEGVIEGLSDDVWKYGS